MEEEVLEVLADLVVISRETHKVDMVEVVAPYTLAVRDHPPIIVNLELVTLVAEVLLVEKVDQSDTVEMEDQESSLLHIPTNN